MATKTGTRFAAAFLLALAAGSCVPGRDEARTSPPSRDEGGATHVAHSALGAYAAGRTALAGGDTRAAADYFAQALRFEPENVELLQRAFTLLAAEGRLDEAAPLAERLLQFDADAPQPLVVAGVRAMQAGDYQTAEARFGQLPKRGITAFLGPLGAAWAQAGQGRTDTAIDSLAALGATGGVGILHAFHAALINDLAGRQAAADENYRLALSGQMSARLVEAAGSFFQRHGRADDAKEIYDRFHAQHQDLATFDTDVVLARGSAAEPAVATARAGLAQGLYDTSVLMRQGNAWDMAMLFARLALTLEPGFPLAQVGLAELLSRQGRLDEANAIYRAVPAQSPLHHFGRLRAAINIDEAGDTEAALKELDTLAKAQPSAIDALVTMGEVLHRRQRFAEAASAYERALARIAQPEFRHWSLFYARGIAFERSKQWPKAEADFRKALELRPDQPDVLNYLGYSLVDQGRSLGEARRMVEKAVELRPNDGAIVDSLGWALYRLGEFQRAVTVLERAIELKPEDPTINDHLGDAYWQVGRIAEAEFQWTRALGLEPEPDQGEAIRTKIEAGAPPAQPLAR